MNYRPTPESAPALQDDLAVFGLVMENEPPEPESDAFPVWKENWPIVELFLDLATQWRVVAGFAGVLYLGLDYTAALALIRFRKLDHPQRVFDLLRVMESAAKRQLNERK